MKRISIKTITKGAPYALITGMTCFVGAYFTTEPRLKNALLFGGLGLVISSVILYITAWKHE